MQQQQQSKQAEMQQQQPLSAEKLRSLLFAQGVEERVEVNQRHLIDKILARYSSEFTLFRELIQNANDAGASHVEVRLSTGAGAAYQPATHADDGGGGETSPSSSSSSIVSSASSAASAILNIFKWGSTWSSTSSSSSDDSSSAGNEPAAKKKGKAGSAAGELRRFGTCVATEIEIRNNGRTFSGDDWNRVRKIAEGNPNSEACGMFGVGFYSVFAVTEQPIVRSGDEYLAFHWKGDMLVTTRGQIESDAPAAQKAEDKKWVSFILEGREPLPLDLDQLCKFLVKSVAFTTNVRQITLLVDGQALFQVRTDTSSGDATSIKVPPKRNPNQLAKLQKDGLGFMTIASLEEHQRVVEVTMYPDTTPSYRVSTRQLAAQVDVHWGLVPTYLENMKRILKKSPPSRTNILMLYNFETLDQERDQFVADLFPSPNNGHIYIGFSTHQTTGSGFHIAAQLIPTVERENIDFQDVYISNWNCNLLSVAGQVSRLYYDHVLASLAHVVPTEETPQSLADQATIANLLEAYSFVDSHPSTQVNTLLSQYYFLSPDTLQPGNDLPVPSASGVIPCRVARLPHLRMEDFIAAARPKGGSKQPSYSIIPRPLYNKCQRFFQQLVKRKLVKNVTLDEMLESVQRRRFSLDDLAALVKWYNASDVQQELFGKNLKEKNTAKLLSATTVLLTAADADTAEAETTDETAAVVEQNLGKVKYYALNKAMRALPVPLGTAHPAVAALCKKELMHRGFGWAELSFAEWWKHVKRNPQFLRGEFGPVDTKRKTALVEVEARRAAVELQREQYLNLMVFIAEHHAKATAQLKQEIVTMLQFNPSILIEDEDDNVDNNDKPPTLTFRMPPDTYHPRVQLFRDIVHVSDELLHKVGKAFLAQLGVRDTVELKIVFDRLEELSWDIQDLVTFLAERQTSFTTADWELLKRSSFLPGIVHQRASVNTADAAADTASTGRDVSTVAKSQMRKACELYFPHPEIVELGFEVLAWPKPESQLAAGEAQVTATAGEDEPVEVKPARGPAAAKRARAIKKKASLKGAADGEFLPTSKQAQLLFKIGLKNAPSIHALVKLAAASNSSSASSSSSAVSSALPFQLLADTDDPMRNAVLSYLEKHAAEMISAEPSFTATNVTAPFLPATLPAGSAYARSLKRKAPATPAPTEPAALFRGKNRKGRTQAQAQPSGPPAAVEPTGEQDLLTRLTPAGEAEGPEQVVSVLCQPGACFLNDSPFGFPVVVPRWRDLAQRLGVAAHPPLSFILDMIVRQPPMTMTEAQQVFAYLFTRINDFKKQDWAVLQASAFVPVFTDDVGPPTTTNAGAGDDHHRHQPKNVTHAKVHQVFIHENPATALATKPDAEQEEKATTNTPNRGGHQQQQRRLKGKAKGKNRRSNNADNNSATTMDEPRRDTGGGGLHTSPREVYDNLLDFVNFGSRANFFLRSCGVGEVPSVEQLAQNFIHHHKRFLAKNGVRRYLQLLKIFATAFPQLTGSAALVNQLAQTPFCVAYQYDEEDQLQAESGSNARNARNDRNDASTREVAVMKRASECYLIDNERLCKLFNPPRVPPVEGSAVLVRMYEELGARWVTADLQQKTIPRGTPRLTDATRQFKQLLAERKPLLTHTMQGKKRKHLRPEAERMLDQLTIYAVDRIERVLQFKGGKKVHEEASVSIVQRRKDDVCLYITDGGDVDYFDVGSELVPMLYAKPKHDDALLVAMLLQTSIPALRRGGWPVDRLLQLGRDEAAAPSAGKPDAYHPLAAIKAGDGHADVTPTSTSTTSEPQLRTTRGEEEEQLVQSNTYKESTHTRDDRRSASGRDHQREMNRQLGLAMRGFSAQAPARVRQEAGEKRSVHYSCEVIPQQTLRKLATVQGVDLYLEDGVDSADELMEAAEGMAALLRKLAGQIFSVPLQSFKMFVAHSGNRIAFNLQRAVYFNLGIYADLHHGRSAAEAMSFWYMTTCHELAHNSFELHNEEHGALLEWIAHAYMPVLHKHLPPATTRKG